MSNTNTSEVVCPIAYEQGENKITVTIEGIAFDNLRRIADGMNDTEWCERGNTPLAVLERWVGELIEQTAGREACYYGKVAVDGIAEVIEDAVDYCTDQFDGDSAERKERRDELRGRILSRFAVVDCRARRC